MILESLGPTATSEMAQVIAVVMRTTIKDSSMDFLTTTPLLIPALDDTVNGYLFKHLRRLSEGGFPRINAKISADSSDPKICVAGASPSVRSQCLTRAGNH